jgi:U3 small nucleolar RNA-associated protein 18
METTTLEHMSISPEGNRLGFIGNHGYIYIADAHSKQWIVDLKINSSLRSMSFLNDHTCITSGYDSTVYLWDIRYNNGKCFGKFSHEDGQATSFLSSYLPAAQSSSSSSSSSGGVANDKFYSLPTPYLSVGSISGVNSIYEGLYDNDSGYYQFCASAGTGMTPTPKPFKSIMNLSTRITSSVFHPSGQILAISSNVVRQVPFPRFFYFI